METSANKKQEVIDMQKDTKVVQERWEFMGL